MQLTEHRHGLWDCIGFSRTRGQIAVQVSSKLEDWAGFTQPPAARQMISCFHKSSLFPLKLKYIFPEQYSSLRCGTH